MTDTVDSTSDSRTINNVMRHAYRVLSDDEKALMQEIKDKGLEFYNLLHKVGGTIESEAKFATRELSVAGTKIEEGVMWAVKHLTK